MNDIATLMDALTRRPTTTPALADAEAWWAHHVQVTADGGPPAHRAVLAGFAADRLGYAFASGYTEALRQLLGDEGRARRRALCASEAGGAHPRAIQCQLDLDETGGGRLRGRKSFVTLGALAEELLIVASTGAGPDGRKRLRVAKIPATRAGLRFEHLPPTSFVPEVPHSALILDAVEVSPAELVPGDGYTEVLEPFRTIEDAHVFLALLGWLTRLGRAAAWPDEQLERGLALIAGFVAIATSATPLSPGVHRALAGLIAGTREHLELLESSSGWTRLPEQTRSRWARDRRLLDVAAKARALRAIRARGP